MKIIQSIRRIRKNFSKYENSIEVLISRESILHNLNEFKSKYRDFAFAPVLKSNAYGHGLLEVAKILDSEKDIPFFVVDSLYEARALRHGGIRKDILIIGYTRLPNILNYNSHKFIFNIISLKELQNLSQNISKKVRIHIKVDTGMHRQGIMIDEVEKAIEIVKQNNKIILEGVSSHLADTHNPNKDFTNSQFQNWKSVVDKFRNNFKNIKYFHISATSGVDVINKEYANLVRLGIGLYGINVSHDKSLNLKPALRLESIITSIRKINIGESVGYGHTFTAEKEYKVATVPAGYYEGIDRKLSNIGFFKIGEKFCKILGRVSMNMTSIDVNEIEKINLEDRVIVISEKVEDKNSVLNISKNIDTIPYEILVHIPAQLKRVIVKNFN